MRCSRSRPPLPDARKAAITGVADLAGGTEALPINQIEQAVIERYASGIGEFDRVLGGGIVPGSATLIGGDPGIGKSTLLLQAAGRLAEAIGRPVLYVTSEESARQTAMRAAPHHQQR